MSPILTSDILRRLSVAAGAGDTTAQGDPNQSLGDQISTTNLVNAALHNLFDAVSGDEATAGDVEYRCFFMLNNHATLTWYAPKAWISSEQAGGASIAIGLDPTGKSARGAAAAQAVAVANESTAPAGVAFSAPTTKVAGLQLPDLGPGECHAIWVRRTVPATTAAIDLDTGVITVEGDSAA